MLGFSEFPQVQRIYVGREGNALWYFWDSTTNEPIPISNPAITCYIKKVELQDLTGAFGSTTKLKVLLQADKTYELVSGASTWFAKTLLVALDALGPDINKQVTLGVKAADAKSKVFFASVYDFNYKLVFANHPWKNLDGSETTFGLEAVVASIQSHIVPDGQFSPVEALPGEDHPGEALPGEALPGEDHKVSPVAANTGKKVIIPPDPQTSSRLFDDFSEIPFSDIPF